MREMRVEHHKKRAYRRHARQLNALRDLRHTPGPVRGLRAIGADDLWRIHVSNTKLDGKRFAIVATDGVEEVELTKPRDALREAGAQAVVVSPNDGEIKAWQHDHWGSKIHVDLPLNQASADEFDGLVLPGGVMNPDHLRQDEQAVKFVKRFFEQGKPVAAICHGPWLLVEADVVRGRTVTSWPSLETDIRNAGGDWVDREVVTDEGLVTSRKPDDIPAFNRKMVEEFAEGIHTGQRKKAQSAQTEVRP